MVTFVDDFEKISQNVKNNNYAIRIHSWKFFII